MFSEHQKAQKMAIDAAAPENEMVEEPEVIFLLTAPFDEEARTGDGQYAESLVEGFMQHSPQTECTWLKAAAGHYRIPQFAGAHPVPEHTIPTIEALQPMANGKIMLLKYQYRDGIRPDSMERWMLENVRFATPRVLYNHLGAAERVYYVRCEDNRPVSLHKDRIGEDIRLTGLRLKHYEEYIKSLEASVREKQQILRERGAGVSRKQINRSIEEIRAEKKGFTEKVNGMRELLKLYRQVENQFDRGRPENLPLLKTLSALSLLPTCSLIRFDSQPLPTLSPPHPIQRFEDALELARNDPLRKRLISNLLLRMQHMANGRPAGIDIHIRPPQTGAFVIPEDIRAFQEAGFVVNLTIHEYTQNYTRPHLQKMTHDMMREANSVLFFNEKDRKDAIKASETGFLVYSDKAQPLHPIAPYDLRAKSRELTVAAQKLTGVPDHPLEILTRPANILSFGTLRRNKGFEEALAIARLIHQRVLGGDNRFLQKIIVAGDPQDTGLVQELFETRYGVDLMQELQDTYPQPAPDASNEVRRAYWQHVKNLLENALEETGEAPANPFLELHPWCESNVLQGLKQECKYVCRIDDMGMRNNGSAIISVLDTGVVYAKWGCVTGKEYLPGGQYDGAIDLGLQKYGDKRAPKIFNTEHQIWSPYRRKSLVRSPESVLDSIIAREEDQDCCAHDLSQSRNFRTIEKSRRLLEEKFTLANSVGQLKKSFRHGVQEFLQQMSHLMMTDVITIPEDFPPVSRP